MDLYNCTFPAMIDDWRKRFRQSSGTSSLFPFGFVQVFLILTDFSLTVKAASLIFISGHGSAISSAIQREIRFYL